MSNRRGYAHGMWSVPGMYAGNRPALPYPAWGAAG